MSQPRVLSNRLWNSPVRRGAAEKSSGVKVAIAVVALIAACLLIAWNFGMLSFLESKPDYTPPTEEQIQQLEEQEKEMQRLEDEGQVIQGGA